MTNQKDDRCDFCVPTYKAKVLFEAPEFFVNIAVGQDANPRIFGDSQGDWLACEICANLILRDDFQALANRSLMMQANYPAIVAGGYAEEIREKIASWHAIFRKEWKQAGSKYRILPLHD